MPSPVVVITGSTKGIGLGMAHAFLSRGCRVVVSGRDPQRIEEALETLTRAAPAERILGRACDVRDPAQVQALWDAAIGRFQVIDIWINNAAANSIEQEFWQHEPEVIRAVTETNLLGTLYGARVAAQGMLAQGSGQIYALEGWGSGGERRRGSTLYGTSKAAIRYFSRSLAAELRGTRFASGRSTPAWFQPISSRSAPTRAKSKGPSVSSICSGIASRPSRRPSPHACSPTGARAPASSG